MNARLTIALSLLAAAPLTAQTGQVEVWIPRTTRALVVDALTQRLAKDRWTSTGVSDYGARFERPSEPILNVLGQPVGQPTTDRLKITFRDLADTLRVSGSWTTVTYPNTATEQSVGRDDPKAVQEVAELLAAVKAVAQNRRAASTDAVASVALAPPPPVAGPAGVAGPPQQQITVAPMATRKEPALSLVLSLLIPGGGQGYNGEWDKAAVMFIGSAVGLELFVSNYSNCVDYFGNSCGNNSTATLGALMFVGNVLWSVIDAPISASRINKRHGFALAPSIMPLKSLGTKPVVGLRVAQIRF